MATRKGQQQQGPAQSRQQQQQPQQQRPSPQQQQPQQQRPSPQQEQEHQQPQQQVEAPAPAGTERTRARRVYVPRTDIYETKEALVLVADMPGVTPDGLDVTLERRELTIRGRTGDAAASEGYSPVHREYESGDYERAFTLSEDIDAGRIEARLKDGVLRLTLPKAGPAQAERIQVQAG